MMTFVTSAQETRPHMIVGCWTVADVAFSRPDAQSAQNRSNALDAVICFLADGTFSATSPSGLKQTGHYSFSEDGKTLHQTRDNAAEGFDQDAEILLLDHDHLYFGSGEATIYLERMEDEVRRHRNIFFTVTNSKTGVPVSFADVLADDNTMATDSVGVFTIDENNIGRSVTISATGYKPLTQVLSETKRNIALEPDVRILREVAVGKPSGKRRSKLGSVRGVDTHMYCSKQALAPLTAKFFKGDGVGPAQYISKIRFAAFASEIGRTISVYLCSVDQNGHPGDQLMPKPVVVTLNKGGRVAEVDVHDLSIALPENGVFLVFCWLSTEENQVHSSTYDKNWYFCEPGLGVKEVGPAPDRWYLKLGGWHLDNRYSLCAQLILTD
jgi:hypothetical protein